MQVRNKKRANKEKMKLQKCWSLAFGVWLQILVRKLVDIFEAPSLQQRRVGNWRLLNAFFWYKFKGPITQLSTKLWTIPMECTCGSNIYNLNGKNKK